MNRVSPETKALVEFHYQVADRISFILKKSGIKQNKFAKMMGKSESEISKWLSGTHNFTTETIVKISLVLKEKIIAVAEENYLQKEYIISKEPFYGNMI